MRQKRNAEFFVIILCHGTSQAFRYKERALYLLIQYRRHKVTSSKMEGAKSRFVLCFLLSVLCFLLSIPHKHLLSFESPRRSCGLGQRTRRLCKARVRANHTADVAEDERGRVFSVCSGVSFMDRLRLGFFPCPTRSVRNCGGVKAWMVLV